MENENEQMSYISFGCITRGARLGAGLSQQEACRELGIDHSYLSKIENDKTSSVPSEKLIRAMARLYGEDEIYFLSRAGYVDVRNMRRVARISPPVALLLYKLGSKREFTADETRMIESLWIDLS